MKFWCCTWATEFQRETENGLYQKPISQVPLIKTEAFSNCFRGFFICWVFDTMQILVLITCTNSTVLQGKSETKRKDQFDPVGEKLLSCMCEAD